MAAVQDLDGKISTLLTDDQTQFVLSTEDFARLSEYVKIALALPKSADEFRARFPEDKLSKYFERDPGLYQGLASQLPINYEECRNYQENIQPDGERFIDTLVTFCRDAQKATQDLHSCFTHVAAKESSLEDPAVRKSLDLIVETIDGLVGRMKELQTRCSNLVVKLSQFETDSTVSRTTLEGLQQRWVGSVPDDDQLRQQHENQVRAAEDRYNAAKQAVDDARQAQKSAYEQRVTHFGMMFLGPVGVMLVAKDLLTGPTLDELNQSAMRAQQDYEYSVRRQSEEECVWLLGTAQLHNAQSSLNYALGSISNAVKGFTAIVTAFSTITSDLQGLASSVKDLKEDISEDDVKDRFFAFDDLERAATRWAKLAMAAEAFRSYSRIYTINGDSVGPNTAYANVQPLGDQV